MVSENIGLVFNGLRKKNFDGSRRIYVRPYDILDIFERLVIRDIAPVFLGIGIDLERARRRIIRIELFDFVRVAMSRSN